MENEIEKEVKHTKQDINASRPKKRIKLIIIASIIGIILGFIIFFIFSSYKLLFSPKKMEFLVGVNSDVEAVAEVMKKVSESNVIKFFVDEKTKVLNFEMKSELDKLSGTTIVGKEFFALKFNNISDNLLLENNELDKFWEKLGVQEYGLPSKINFRNNSFNFTMEEKIKINNFLNECFYKILNNLDSDSFVKNSDKLFTINGQDRSLKTIELQLTEPELFMIQKEVLTLFDKKGISEIFVNKVNKLGNTDIINKEKLDEELDKYIAYLDYTKAYYDLQNEENEYYIIYRMYYDDQNNIIARELTEKYNYEGNLYEDIICRLITDNNNFYELKVFNQEDYSRAYYNVISDKVTINGNIKSHNISCKVEGFYVGYSEEESNYKYVPVDSEVNYNLALYTLDNGVNKIDFADENNIYTFAMQHDNNNANIEFINNSSDFKIKIDIKKENITKEDLLNQRAVLLNEKTQEEIMTEFNNIGSKLSKLFAK